MKKRKKWLIVASAVIILFLLVLFGCVQGPVNYERDNMHAANDTGAVKANVVNVEPGPIIGTGTGDSKEIFNGHLSGYVLETPGGHPISGAEIWMWKKNNVLKWAETKADENGIFTFSLVYPGLYEVAAYAPGFGVTKAQTVQVSKNSSPITFKLTKDSVVQPGRLTITVLDKAGKPVPDAQIVMELQGGGSSVKAQTNTEGVATLPLPSIGSYEIGVYRNKGCIAGIIVAMMQSGQSISTKLTIP